ncbi:tRNA-2-methylthio-N(6)-dimethylallyladenosine synthase [Andreesenia angusta]|uniref:tRNA-2-methylthio-N(6)-dimethylallyladenosine synthase n=1 Tax=Andreesenia angusta TaxID=39480 RepID=A0A1S1V8G8_9FIRM|nr:tRNA (N6-isopentenyl adenosine(37)-C2)-methylthiotransferase MiaB [Andreesenia angusta]OHW62886.1 tRNA-2-methylthio-N(6)-dimethylallyladenosine synthase [Andreesenia angusta]
MSEREITTVSQDELERQEVYIEALNRIDGKRKKSCYIETYGCQMNEHDSEKMEAILERLGYVGTETKEDADLILINTCLVRENAELKVYGKVGSLKHLKENNPEIILGICGCMMQQEEVRKVIKEKHSFMDLIFGTHNIHKLPEYIYKHNQQSGMIVDVWEDGGRIVEGVPSKRKFDHKALVNITFGCNNFCTYCIVPYTRGREKSREVEDILEEIRGLISEGCKEITLLGQNVNSYGKTLENRIAFADLLREIDKLPGIERVRFMTSHPKDLSDELISAMAECDSVCEHIHLPFQAGNNRVLKTMNRKYTKEQYLELVDKIKRAIPDIAITTDIIVGFPGETYEEFEDTLDVVRKVGFDAAYTYLYSIREGTPAAEMKDQIPEDEKSRRFKELLDTLNPIGYEKNLKMVGKVESVLVEGTSKNNEEVLSGRTRSGKLINFKGTADLIGSIVDVKIEEARTWTLNGSLAGEA